MKKWLSTTIVCVLAFSGCTIGTSRPPAGMSEYTAGVFDNSTPERHGNTHGNLKNGGHLVEYDDGYCVSFAPYEPKVSHVSYSGKIPDGVILTERAAHLNIVDERLYFTSQGSIYGMDLTGANKTKICDGDDPQVVNDSIFYIDNDRNLHRIRTDGKLDETLVPTATSQFFAYDSSIYYLESNSTQLKKCDFDGQNKTIVSDIAIKWFLQEGNTIYYASESGDFGKMNSDGTESTILLSGFEPFHTNVYEGTLYFSNSIYNGLLHRVNYETESAHVLPDVDAAYVHLASDFIGYMDEDNVYQIVLRPRDNEQGWEPLF